MGEVPVYTYGVRVCCVCSERLRGLTHDPPQVGLPIRLPRIPGSREPLQRRPPQKITTHLSRISLFKAASGTNWSNKRTCRLFIVNSRRDLPGRVHYPANLSECPGLDPPPHPTPPPSPPPRRPPTQCAPILPPAHRGPPGDPEVVPEGAPGGSCFTLRDRGGSRFTRRGARSTPPGEARRFTARGTR